MIIFVLIIIIIIIYINYNKKHENFIDFIKNIPKAYNCKFKNFSNNPKDTYINTGIKYNLSSDKTNPKYYPVIVEVSNEKFQKLLNTIIDKKKYIFSKKFVKIRYLNNNNYFNTDHNLQNKNDYYNKKFYIILKFLLDRINNITKFIPFKFNNNFEIMKSSLLYLGKHDNYYKYIFDIIIYRRNKLTGFSLRCTSYYDINKNDIYISEIKILGNITSHQISTIINKIKDFTDNDNKYVNIWWKYPFKSFEKSDNEFKKKIIQNNQNLMEVKNSKNKKQNIYNYLCYSKDNEIQWNSSNKIICESNVDFFNKSKEIGIWDRKCISDYECPFFRSNRNYNNNFGGCYNGYCELPINMKLFGFRNYLKDKKYKPFCYNCPDGKIGMCCDEQKNKNKYPLLNTPDYVFKNDIISRFKSKDNLKAKNLNWHNLID